MSKKKQHNLILLGEPLSTNHIYKFHCKFGFPSGYMSADGKTLKDSYVLQAKNQFKSKPLTEELSIRIKLYFSRKGKHDYDNYGKIFNDALSGIVWKDDSQIKKALIEVCYDKDNPRIELIVEEFINE